MTNEEKPKFLEILNGCASAYRQVIDKPLITIFWDLLEPYEINAVEKAFFGHIRTKTFFPNPSEIISVLDAKLKRIGADEAWAIAFVDESETVVWTDEMSAAFAIASPLLADGDKIGARMAFKSAYERLCNEAELIQKPVVWRVSLGGDKSTIAPALVRAASLGRISKERALELLPGSTDGGFIGRLLTGKAKDDAESEQYFKKNWSEIKGALANISANIEQRDQEKRDLAVKKQQEFEARRRDALDKCGLNVVH